MKKNVRSASLMVWSVMFTECHVMNVLKQNSFDLAAVPGHLPSASKLIRLPNGIFAGKALR